MTVYLNLYHLILFSVHLLMIAPRDVKVKALLDMPRPTSRKQVQSLLGSTGYYQRYIPRYAQLVAPLTNLLRKRSVFTWSDEAEQSYVKLKQFLASSPVLAIADFNKKCFLFIDAITLQFQPFSC